MELKRLLERLDYEVKQGSDGIDITGLFCDSRDDIEAGSLFVCVDGAVCDGHKFARDVSKRGAVAVVAEKDVDVPDNVTVIRVSDSRYALALISAAYFGYPAKSLRLIGVTGTKGKTTTTYMIKSILEKAGHKVGLIGTVENITGKRTYPSKNSTPESFLIHKYLREMVDSGCDTAVAEVSSQGLMLHRTAGIRFDIGIFTNLGEDHIGPNEHKDFEEYKNCKAMLFRQCRVGIGNADDPYYDDIFAGSDCEKETFGFSEGADYRATDTGIISGGGRLGTTFHVSGKIDADIETGLPGQFNIYNALAAIAAARHFGVTKEEIAAGLKDVKVRGRTEILNVPGDYILMIDYAHNAMSLESLLITLMEYNPVRIVCLFGCGGNRAKARRREMGEVSGRLADFTIITSDNPRFEDPADIIADIREGIDQTSGKYIEIADRAEAIAYAVKNARKGDIIVLAGKGHEDYQEIRGVRREMDERKLVAAALERVRKEEK